MMNNNEAITLVKSVFAKIKLAATPKELEKIIEGNSLLKKYEFDSLKFPNLTILISHNEIEHLKTENILTDNNTISVNLDWTKRTPLEKLMYSILWKNGDLRKERHIVEGILSTANLEEDKNKTDGLVFNQFGKHLATRKEPIVDQHTLRAFLVYQASDDSLKIDEIRSKTSFNNQDCHEFKQWLDSVNIGGEINQFYIDKVLFALGKAIKLSKRRN